MRAMLVACLFLGCSSSDDGGSTDGGTTTDTGTIGATDAPAGDNEPAALDGITAAHNAARAAVGATPAIPPLTWSSTVAATAQAWSDKCQFMHSGGMYGENIYAGTGKATPQAVVDDWVSEKADYDYASNSCTATCGHYTQVVWRKSVRLGCGVTECTSNSPFGSGSWEFWVCNYDPPGNFGGEKPY